MVQPPARWSLDFSQPGMRSEYLRRPERLIEACRAMPRRRQAAVVLIDEAQNVPSILDAVQHLYDGDKKRWRFILCGSSARKLRLTGANLLPGRALLHRLYPLVVSERPFTQEESFAGRIASPLPLPATHMIADEPLFPATALIDRLIYGELPAVAVVPARDRAAILQSYTTIYLEEELRREALIKDWGVFARFLQLAASASAMPPRSWPCRRRRYGQIPGPCSSNGWASSCGNDCSIREPESCSICAAREGLRLISSSRSTGA
ncbi:MAG: AAA family ATPase [Steroidobacteraceae bacterium]